MIELKYLIEAYIRVEKSPTNITVADGEAGRGIYFSLSRYPEMVDYYRKNIEHRLIQAIPHSDAKVLDLTGTHNNHLLAFMRKEIEDLSKRNPGYIKPKITKRNYQRFGRLIQDFIRKFHPDTDAYIVNHEAEGTELPKGKQLIVIDAEAFDFKDLTSMAAYRAARAKRKARRTAKLASIPPVDISPAPPIRHCLIETPLQKARILSEIIEVSIFIGSVWP